jgi:hypothetical protein
MNGATPSSDVVSNPPIATVQSNEISSETKNVIYSVPFSHRRNVEYDGVKLFKNNTSGIPSVAFDSYAQTLEPVTEIKFAASDTEFTKRIVLATKPFSGYQYGQIEEPKFGIMTIIPNSLVTIGLMPEGQIYLPNREDSSYTTGDLFTLKVEEGSKIVLFKNDEQLLSYPNPSSDPLYAQIWFREPTASLLAVATAERAEKVSTSRSKTISTDYDVVVNDGNVRALLRGRMIEYMQ